LKKNTKRNLCVAFGFLIIFALWTLAVRFIDIASIGPNGSKVGFSTLNRFVHDLTGVNMTLYNITDWLGLVPFAVVLAFAALGLAQWIKRRSIAKVDSSILVLGGFYTVVLAIYAFFEIVPINYRPVLIEGVLEVSYPSSTTMLVMCVMPTAIIQLNSRIKSLTLKYIISSIIIAFTAFMVIGRVISGVHWASDIIGGAILSCGLVMMYYSTIEATKIE